MGSELPVHWEGATVFVVDDDASVRRGVDRLLRSVGLDVESYESGATYLERARDDGPGCVVLDVKMPHVNGLQLQRQFSDEGLIRPIVFLTGHGDIPMSVRAMRRGAVDFLTKPVDEWDLLRAVDRALKQDMEARVSRAKVERLAALHAALTPRERQVMALVVAGSTNPDIAGELGISVKTVKVHRGRVMTKMQADTLADLVRAAERLHGG